MTTKITLTLKLPTDNPTAHDVGNAVRRAVSALSDTALIPSIPVIAKGVTIKSRTVQSNLSTQPSPIRAWAAQNGHPEVIGKRGRLSRAVIAEYEAAHK